MDYLFESSVREPDVREQRTGLSEVCGWNDAWVPNLQGILTEQGLEDVNRHYVPVSPQMLPPWGHLQVLVMEERQRHAVKQLGRDHKKVKQLETFLDRWRREAKEGIYTYYDPVIVSARKPDKL